MNSRTVRWASRTLGDEALSRIAEDMWQGVRVRTTLVSVDASFTRDLRVHALVLRYHHLRGFGVVARPKHPQRRNTRGYPGRGGKLTAVLLIS